MGHIGIALTPPDTNEPYDIYLDDTGNLAMVQDAHAVGQHVRQRLKTYEGEWFLDTSAGVTWLTDILGKKYDPALADAIIKAEIYETDGVTEITSLSVKYDWTKRELTGYAITVLTTYDEAIDL